MSDDITDRAKATLEGTTDGPWEADLDPHGETRGIWPTSPGEEIIIGEYIANDEFDSNRWAGGSDQNLRFMAAARTLVPELIAEVERGRRACKTLGGIVESQCRMALDASGLHHLIDEDGDGDWAAVWEKIAELGAANNSRRKE